MIETYYNGAGKKMTQNFTNSMQTQRLTNSSLSHINYCKQFINKNDKVLDVGSGRGNFVVGMAREGFAAYGVEPNHAYIDIAYQKAAEENLQISVFKSGSESLPFQDNYFDFINSAEVTEHVNDPLKMCNEIHRVLKQGKRCYISFSNRWGIYDYHYHLYFINWMPISWTESVLKFLGKQKEDGPAGRQKLTTMYYYTYNQVIKILTNAGFSIEDIRVNKIKQKFGFLSIFVLPIYYLFLRPFYFNTFHLLVEKNK